MSAHESVMRPRRWRRLLVSGVLLTVAATTFAACGSDDGDKTGGTTDLVFSLDFKIDGYHAPFYVAQDNGSYADAGLKVTLNPSGGGADAIARVAAGKADMGVVSALAVTTAIADNSAPIQAVGAFQQKIGNAIISLKKSGIETPDDLKGKTLGVNNAAPSGQHLGFMEINGLAESDLTVQPAQGSTMIPGLLAGEFDAISMQPQLGAQIGDQASYMPWGDYGFDTYGHVLIVNKKYLSKHGDAVRDFVHATMEGMKYTVEHPAEAAAITAKASGNPGDEEYFVKELAIVNDLYGGDVASSEGYGHMSDERWKSTQDIVEKYLGLKNPVDLSQLYTDKYLGDPVK